jgi:hypothetical protein
LISLPKSSVVRALAQPYALKKLKGNRFSSGRLVRRTKTTVLYFSKTISGLRGQVFIVKFNVPAHVLQIINESI